MLDNFIKNKAAKNVLDHTLYFMFILRMKYSGHFA